MFTLPIKDLNVTSAAVEVDRLLRNKQKLQIHPSFRFPPANTIVVKAIPAFLLNPDTI